MMRPEIYQGDSIGIISSKKEKKKKAIKLWISDRKSLLPQLFVSIISFLGKHGELLARP